MSFSPLRGAPNLRLGASAINSDAVGLLRRSAPCVAEALVDVAVETGCCVGAGGGGRAMLGVGGKKPIMPGVIMPIGVGKVGVGKGGIVIFGVIGVPKPN